MLDDLGAKDTVKRSICIFKTGLDIRNSAYKSVSAVLLNRHLRYINSVQAMTFLCEQQRICARPAADIQDFENPIFGNAVHGELLTGTGKLSTRRVFIIVKCFYARAHVSKFGSVELFLLRSDRSASDLNSRTGSVERHSVSFAYPVPLK